MTTYRRIMYATDFSPASLAAFDQALALARLSGAELVIVHSLPWLIPIAGESLYISAEAWDTIREGARADARKQLDDLAETARKSEVQATTRLVEGVPADEIVRAAEKEHVDLLVMGTHGRTGVSKFFLGSVANRVVPAAPCPVLTVRSKA